MRTPRPWLVKYRPADADYPITKVVRNEEEARGLAADIVAGTNGTVIEVRQVGDPDA